MPDISVERNPVFHAILWCFMVVFVFDYHWFEVSWLTALIYSMVEVAGYMVMFYVNQFWLKWTSRNMNSRFMDILGSVVLGILYIILIRWSGLEYYFYEAGPTRNMFSMAVNAILFIGLSYLVYYVQKGNQQRELNLKLRAENSQMQVEYLKGRINPHFVFNTLNNLYALILNNQKNVPQMVSKLSSVLRYAVDDGDKSRLPITKEYNHLQDYLALIQLQDPASDKIDVYAEGLSDQIEIIPFVCISLLENAIKHGDLKYNENGFLHLSLIIDDNFCLEIENSKSGKQKNTEGTGLKNIVKQLDLAYGEQYRLEIQNNLDNYKISLHIELSKMMKNAV